MELYILLEGYISNSIPESYIGSLVLGEVTKNIGLQASATEVQTFIYIVVCNGEIPGARFLPVSFAIGEASIPSGVIVRSCSCVLPVFTENIELLNRNSQIYSIEFIFQLIIVVFELNVVSAQFCEAEVIASFCKQCIRVIKVCNSINSRIELTEPTVALSFPLL